MTALLTNTKNIISRLFSCVIICVCAVVLYIPDAVSIKPSGSYASYTCGSGGSGNAPSCHECPNDECELAANTCTPPSGQVFAGWRREMTNDVYQPGDTVNVSSGEPVECNGGFGIGSNFIAQYEVDYPFSVTTTNIPGNQIQYLDFRMTAQGTFYVDCGSDGTLAKYNSSNQTYESINGNTITRSDTTLVTYACGYPSISGVKTIRFGGVATGYSASAGSPAISILGSNKWSVASVSGNMSAVFPYLGSSNNQHPQFYGTFQNSSLTSIDGTLFSDYTVAGGNMFYRTFYGTSLTSIPSGLFNNITTVAANAFYQTFMNCSHLTSLPDDLFSNITNTAYGVFYQTFSGCTGLTGYIPTTMFAGLISNNSPTANMLMYQTFYDTGSLATSCSSYSGKGQYITGYESSWDGHVSCADGYTVTYSCGVGTGTPPESTVAVNKFTPAANTCNKTGYSFNGWSVSGTTAVKPAGVQFDWTYTQNKTFTATFIPSVYNITYSCGTTGGNAPTTNTSATYGTSFTPASNSCTVPNGYSFDGWAVSDTNDVISSATTWNYTEDKTLTATFTPSTYTVTYSCGTLGGTAPSASNNALYDSYFFPAANTCTLPTGYTFDGWLISGTNTKVSSSFKWTYNENKTFTAQSVPNVYTVTYSCGEGSGNAPTTNTSATYDASFTPATNTCTKTGYTFDGWAISGTNDIESTAFTWDYTEDKTLTAQWALSSYTCQSGKYLPANGTSCTNCASGYTCSGGTFNFDPDEDQGLTPNTLTVRWTDWAGNTTQNSCEYGGSVTLPSSSQSRDGYTFDGWEVVP